MELPLGVPERVKTDNLKKLGNIRKVVNLHKIKAKCPLFLQKQKFC